MYRICEAGFQKIVWETGFATVASQCLEELV
jgi:hypothetical protein